MRAHKSRVHARKRKLAANFPTWLIYAYAFIHYCTIKFTNEHIDARLFLLIKFTDFPLHNKMDLKKQDRTTDKSHRRWVSMFIFLVFPALVEFCKYVREFIWVGYRVQITYLHKLLRFFAGRIFPVNFLQSVSFLFLSPAVLLSLKNAFLFSKSLRYSR